MVQRPLAHLVVHYALERGPLALADYERHDAVARNLEGMIEGYGATGKFPETLPLTTTLPSRVVIASGTTVC